jgi:poly-beta-1,6-N-acetyl-D-glucosamine synthase
VQRVFAISLALLAYTYAGYPLLIWVLSRVRGRPVKKGGAVGGVSVLIAAHNEADTLPRKLESLLELATADPIREIWVGLDGCTDGTGEAVREGIRNSEFRIQNGRAENLSPVTGPEIRISNVQGEAGEVGERSEVRGQGSGEQSVPCPLSPAIHILEFDQCRGKAAVLNDLMDKATQPFLVMMDARQRVEAGAISRLLENFADPQVGVVSGRWCMSPRRGRRNRARSPIGATKSSSGRPKAVFGPFQGLPGRSMPFDGNVAGKYLKIRLLTMFYFP